MRRRLDGRPRHPSRFLPVLLYAACSLIISSCGSDDGPTANSSIPPEASVLDRLDRLYVDIMGSGKAQTAGEFEATFASNMPIARCMHRNGHHWYWTFTDTRSEYSSFGLGSASTSWMVRLNLLVASRSLRSQARAIASISRREDEAADYASRQRDDYEQALDACGGLGVDASNQMTAEGALDLLGAYQTLLLDPIDASYADRADQYNTCMQAQARALALGSGVGYQALSSALFDAAPPVSAVPLPDDESESVLWRQFVQVESSSIRADGICRADIQARALLDLEEPLEAFLLEHAQEIEAVRQNWLELENSALQHGWTGEEIDWLSPRL